jgi:hypothetical protein
MKKINVIISETTNMYSLAKDKIILSAVYIKENVKEFSEQHF